MKTIGVLFVIAATLLAQVPIGTNTGGGGGSGPSSTISATPDYIISTGASPAFSAKPYATSTYWQHTLTSTTSGTLTTTNAPNGMLMGWRIVQGGSGSYSFTWPAAVIGAPTMDGTFCNAVGDAMYAEGVLSSTGNVLITLSACIPATPGAAAFRDSTGVKTFASGTFTVSGGASFPTEAANYGFAFPPVNWAADFSGVLSFSANQVKVFGFYSGPTNWTLAKAYIKINTASASNSIVVGVYDATCSTLLSSGSITSASTGDGLAVTMSTYAMTPNRYYLAVGSTSGTATLGAMGLGASPYTSLTAGPRYIGNAANTLSGTTMPASCGAISGTPTTFPFALLAAQ